MKNRIFLTLSITAIVISSIALFSPARSLNIAKTQRERIEILERAKYSSDPAVLKQAELVRNDIEGDYHDLSKIMSEMIKEFFKMPREVRISFNAAVPAGLILGTAYAVYQELQFRREKRRNRP